MKEKDKNLIKEKFIVSNYIDKKHCSFKFYKYCHIAESV